MSTKILYMTNEAILPKNTAGVSVVFPGVQAASCATAALLPNVTSKTMPEMGL